MLGRRFVIGGQSPAKLAVVAAALLGLLIAPLAIAETDGPGAGPEASAAATRETPYSSLS